MKNKFWVVALLVCAFAISSCAHPEAPSGSVTASPVVEPEIIITENPPSLPTNNLLDAYRSDLDELQGASIYTVDMMIDLIGGSANVGGTVEVVYTNQESVPLSSIYFRLFPNVGGDYLTVSDVKIDDKTIAPVLEFSGTAIRLDLEQALAPGDSISISMRFDETVPTVMGGNYGLYIYMDDILALDAFLPIIPVYNDEGWNVEEPPANADMVFADVSFFSVTVDAPAELVLAAGGEETAREEKDGRQVVTYAAGPQRDFYLAASPNYVTASTIVDGVKVTSYFPPEFREAGEQVLEVGANALEIFGQRLGYYPYTELDIVSTPMGALGMEYSNIVAMGIKYYDPDIDLGGTPASVYLESAAAHEVGHQWFYSQVMDDQIDTPWMDESLVQYVTYLYYVDMYGSQNAGGFMSSLEGRWARVNNDPIPIGLPADDYSGAEYSAIVYGRGALFFDALAAQMGQNNFDAFLRDYVKTYRWKVVEPEDMLSTAEAACGCDLEPIFKEWGAVD